MKIRLTFQKLLTFDFFKGNALKLPKNRGFGGILGVKTVKFIFLNPKAHPWSKARVLMYYASKLVHAFDYGPMPSGEKKWRPAAILDFQLF
jgi:hypothetical protein